MFFLDVFCCHSSWNCDGLLAVRYCCDPVGTGAAAAYFFDTWGKLVFCSWENLIEGNPAGGFVFLVFFADFLVSACRPVFFEDVSFLL